MADGTPNKVQEDTAQGFVCAALAFFLWGLFPLYLKAVNHIPIMEVVAHRVIWSVPVAGLLLYLLGRTADVRRALKSPKMLVMAALTAALISFNWGLYVWAIATERALEGALGYYINPLVNIAMGAILLGEALGRLQKIAIGLAAVAIVIMTIEHGSLPLVSLALAFSFATYGFLRKTLPIGPSQGFFLEVLILTPPAVIYTGYLIVAGVSHFSPDHALDIGLLLFAGPVTAVPLLLYGFGAKGLRYTTIGIMQYIAPTMIFLLAVFVFKEPFSVTKLIAFMFIWSALIVYSLSFLRPKSRL